MEEVQPVENSPQTSSEVNQDTDQPPVPEPTKTLEQGYKTATPKIKLIIPIFLFLVGLSGFGFYFINSQNIQQPTEVVENQQQETVVERSSPCTSEYDESSSNISLPQNDRSVILATGSVNKDFQVSLESWFLPEGSSDRSYSESEEVLIQLQDRQGEVLYTWNTSKDSFFTIRGEPGIRETMDKGVFALTFPYESTAKRLVWKVDGKSVYDENVQLKLIRDTLSRLSDQAYLQNNTEEKINDSLTEVEECILSGDYKSASRVLEFEILPIINEGVSGDYRKQVITDTEKVDLVNVIEDSIVRLDPTLATATITPIPEQEGNIHIRRELSPATTTTLYITAGEGYRFHEQNFQIEFITYHKLNCSDNDVANENVECIDSKPEQATLLLTDRNTSETKTVTLDLPNPFATFKNFELELSDMMDHLNSIDVHVTNTDESRYGL